MRFRVRVLTIGKIAPAEAAAFRIYFIRHNMVQIFKITQIDHTKTGPKQPEPKPLRTRALSCDQFSVWQKADHNRQSVSMVGDSKSKSKKHEKFVEFYNQPRDKTMQMGVTASYPLHREVMEF